MTSALTTPSPFKWRHFVRPPPNDSWKQVLAGENHPPGPRVINTDKHAGQPACHPGEGGRGCCPLAVRTGPSPLNNVIEAGSPRHQGTGSKPAATSALSVAPPPRWRAMKPCAVPRKGQVSAGAPAGAVQAQNRRIEALFGVAA